VEVEVKKEIERQDIQKVKSELEMNSIIQDSMRSIEATNIECKEIGFSNLTNTTTSIVNENVGENSLMCSCIKDGNYHGSLCFNCSCQHFIRVNDSFYSIRREASKQVLEIKNGSGVLLPLQSNVNFNTYSRCNQIKVETDNCSPQRIHFRDENQEKDHDLVCLSAVERARQREISKNPSCEKKLLTMDYNEAIKSSNKTTSNIALAFRSPHRQVFLIL